MTMAARSHGDAAATWYEATAVSRPQRPALTFDLDVDVCVIGGGLAGLTTARELALRGWSVAVLEGERIGDAASGRNAGFVLPGFSQSMAVIAERVGLDQARRMWALAEAGRAYVEETIATTQMPGVAPEPGWLAVAKYAPDPSVAAEVKRLGETFGAAVEFWPAERVRAALYTPFYYEGAYFPTAFHIHPLNYVLGLAAAAERAGARIFEGTPALALDPAGVRKRIATSGGRVRASQVVLAGNVRIAPLQPRLAATLMPVTTFVAVTAPLGPRLAEAIAFKGAVSDGAWADNHYRIVGGDRLLWSGGVRTFGTDPRPFASRLAADIRRVFPQLGRVDIAHVWAGTLGRTVHRMPQIGEVMPGLWVASGFGGHGLNTTAMAGVLIARAIATGDSAWRVFEPYELVWAGGRAGRALVQAAYAASRLHAQVRAALSRWQHRRWVRAARRAAVETAATGPAATAEVRRGRAPVSEGGV